MRSVKNEEQVVDMDTNEVSNLKTIAIKIPKEEKTQ